MTLKDIFSFYEEKVAPAYSFLVALTGEKPLQVLVEVENTFAHISRGISGDHEEQNYNKAYNHMVRLYIDLYKLLIIEIKKIYESSNPQKSLIFVDLMRKAREYELKNIGNPDPKITEAVGLKYADAINVALKDLGMEKL